MSTKTKRSTQIDPPLATFDHTPAVLVPLRSLPEYVPSPIVHKFVPLLRHELWDACSILRLRVVWHPDGCCLIPRATLRKVLALVNSYTQHNYHRGDRFTFVMYLLEDTEAQRDELAEIVDFDYTRDLQPGDAVTEASDVAA